MSHSFRTIIAGHSENGIAIPAIVSIRKPGANGSNGASFTSPVRIFIENHDASTDPEVRADLSGMVANYPNDPASLAFHESRLAEAEIRGIDRREIWALASSLPAYLAVRPEGALGMIERLTRIMSPSSLASATVAGPGDPEILARVAIRIREELERGLLAPLKSEVKKVMHMLRTALENYRRAQHDRTANACAGTLHLIEKLNRHL